MTFVMTLIGVKFGELRFVHGLDHCRMPLFLGRTRVGDNDVVAGARLSCRAVKVSVEGWRGGLVLEDGRVNSMFETPAPVFVLCIQCVCVCVCVCVLSLIHI